MKTTTSKITRAVLGAAALAIAAPLWAQETVPARDSLLAYIKLPANALRINPKNVPKEINDALTQMMKEGGSQVRRGSTEVIAWTGGGYSLKQAPKLKAQAAAAFKSNGWTYEESAPQPGAQGVTMVSALKTVPTRKALIGFWAPTKDAMLLAWTEMLPANNTAPQPEAAEPAAEEAEPAAATESAPEAEEPAAAEPEEAAEPKAPAAPASAVVVDLEDQQQAVDAAKGLPRPKVSFAPLKPLPGKARGYVKGADGKPLKGAVIGVRSTAVGGAETGAEAKTDAKGYYEIEVPFGAAGFYASGYTAEFGGAMFALGLTPADGEADEFASAKGHVENWIMVPYGIADKAAIQDNPRYLNNYFGGGIVIWYLDENSGYAYPKGLPFGCTVEITLTPKGALMDGSKGRVLTFRKVIRDGMERRVNINDIPIGKYRLSARMIHKGKSTPVNLKETGPESTEAFGLSPRQAQGEVDLSLRPYSARASSATAGKGNWKEVGINIMQ